MDMPKIPWMHPDEIKMIEKYLGPNKIMLEWGSGGSTLYFSRKVKQYFAIEHDQHWYNELKENVPENVTLIYRAPNQKVPIAESSYLTHKDYIDAAADFGVKFDFVLIDGRSRFACSQFILDHLHKNSVVFFHDFYKRGRDRYRKALEYYNLKESVTNTKQGLAVLTPKYHFKRNYADLLMKIIYAAVHKESLSVVRLGDGEYLAATSPESQSERNNVPFQKHMGYVPSMQIKKEISQNIIDSAKQADILCLNEYADPKWAIPRNYFFKIRNNLYYYTADFHIYWMREQIFDTIFLQFNNVLIINGHDLRSQLKQKYPHLQNIDFLEIPKQPRYFKEKRNHYPDYFKKVISEINSRDLYGYLCLIGGGFIGKKYVIECAKRGGVALDIGSVFDRWAGFITRGKQKGFEKSDNQFKL